MYVAQTCFLGLRLLFCRRLVLPTGAGQKKLPADRPSTDGWRLFLCDPKSRRPKEQVCASDPHVARRVVGQFGIVAATPRLRDRQVAA
jgi:hypothetical protein